MCVQTSSDSNPRLDSVRGSLVKPAYSLLTFPPPQSYLPPLGFEIFKFTPSL